MRADSLANIHHMDSPFCPLEEKGGAEFCACAYDTRNRKQARSQIAERENGRHGRDRTAHSRRR